MTEPATGGLPRIGPSVHAIVVAHSPGDWFEETLRSLRDQDHSNLDVTVVDTSPAVAGSGLAERVSDFLPEASVLFVDGNPGFSAAVNAAIEAVGKERLSSKEDEPAYLLICHDDISLSTDAVTRLAEEAMSSGAGVVGPKLVDWDDPRSLQSLGLTVDKLGAPIPLITPGELDQGHHDDAATVLAVASACMLVDVGLYKRLGGFDSAISFHGEDTDFGWRATIAGTSVRVAPAAVVRHRARLSERVKGLGRDRLAWRHNLRSCLVCAHPHEVGLIPLAILMIGLESLAAFLTGHFRRFLSLTAAWPWNLLGLPEILRRRRQLSILRSEESQTRVVRLQSRNVVSLRRYLRALLSGSEHSEGFLGRGSRYWSAFRSAPVRLSIAAWVTIGAIFLFGGRHLITRSVPVLGEIAPFGESPGDLFSDWLSGWRPEGLGMDGHAPTALFILGMAGSLLFGSLALARTVLLVGLIPFGALGIWRFMGQFGSKRGQIAGLAAFVFMPLPYNAMANGNWSALGVYGVLPWILLWMSRATALEGEGSREGILAGWVTPTLAVGMLLGLLGAFVPLAVMGVLLLALAIVAGGLLAGRAERLPRLVVVTLGGLALGWALNWPSAPRSWRGLVDFGGARPAGLSGYKFSEMLRFDTGVVGERSLIWGMLALGALGLLLARGQRLIWMFRAWILVLASVLIALANERGWLLGDLPRAELLLAPAAVGLAMAVAVSVSAVDGDVRSLNRSLLTGAAGIALLIGSIPVLGLTLDGRWGMPEGDYSSSLAAVERESAGSAFRILWVGHPDVLPLAGRPLDGELVYATSTSGIPEIGSQWVSDDPGESELLADAWRDAIHGNDNRLGEALVPLGVRYLIVVERIAPEPFGQLTRQVPPRVTRRLEDQLDLEHGESRTGLKVFRNTNGALSHAVLAGTGPLSSQELLAGASPFPVYEDSTTAKGIVNVPVRVYLADAAAGWRLSLEGQDVPSAQALGWARVFNVDSPGEVELGYDSPLSRSVHVWQILLWVFLLALAVFLSLSRRRVT